MDTEDMHQQIDLHSTEIALLKQKQDEHARLIEQLQANDVQILQRLAVGATHEDIMMLHEKLDNGINGLLREALNAVPSHASNELARHALWWNVVGVLIAIAAFGATYLRHG